METKKVTKGMKIRIYPNFEQKQLIEKHIDCCTSVYNHFLTVRKELWESEKKSLSFFDTTKLLTILKKEEGAKRLTEIGSHSLYAVLKDLDEGYQALYRKQSKHPHFKKRGSGGAFRTITKVSAEGNKLFCEKFRKDNYIKMAESDKIHDKIKFVTISKTPTDKYFASFVFETEHEILPKTGLSIGIDTGLKDMAILSNGVKFENLRALEGALKKLKYEQRQLSKKQKGSSRWELQRIKVAKAYEKVTNIRIDYIHKVTIALARKYDLVAVEDLKIKNFMKNHKVARAFSDVALGTFYEKLKYKIEWNDKDFVMIGQFFASTQLCHKCGWKNKELTLNAREWECKQCGSEHDRDINASINILNEGMRIKDKSGFTSNSDSKPKCGEASPLGESMNRKVTGREKAYTKEAHQV